MKRHKLPDVLKSGQIADTDGIICLPSYKIFIRPELFVPHCTVLKSVYITAGRAFASKQNSHSLMLLCRLYRKEDEVNRLDNLVVYKFFDLAY